MTENEAVSGDEYSRHRGSVRELVNMTERELADPSHFYKKEMRT